MTDPGQQAEWLQRGLDRIAAGEPVEQVLADLGHDPELAALLAFTLQVAEVAPAAPRPAFRARLEVHLAQLMSSRRAAVGWRRPRLALRLAALAAALLLALGSAVVVSADSLPGDVLYPVKLATERTRLVLATNPATRARLHLRIADRRLKELRPLVERGQPPPPSVVGGLVRARQAAVVQARAAGDQALVEEVQEQAAAAGQAVAELVEGAPPAVRAVLEQARATLQPVPSATAIPATPAISVPGTQRLATASPPPSPTARQAGWPSPKPIAGEPTSTPSATVRPTQARPRIAPASPVPVATWTPASPPPRGPTAVPTGGTAPALVTQRWVQLTREAQATATATPPPPPRRRGDRAPVEPDPTAIASPTATAVLPPTAQLP